MRVVAANADALVIRLPCGSGRAGILVSKDNVVMNEVADGLHPRPARVDVSEVAPGNVGQAIRLAIPASEQEHESLLGQILHRVLTGGSTRDVRLPRVPNHSIAADSNAARGRHDSRAPVAETVAIACNRN